MNIKRLEEGVLAAKRIILENPHGGTDQKVKKEMLDACNAMEWSLDEGDYFIEKIGDLRIAVDSFFSARKHLRFEDDSSSGIVVLRFRINSLLDRIEGYSVDLKQKERQSP